jgi:hypothetical protein
MPTTHHCAGSNSAPGPAMPPHHQRVRGEDDVGTVGIGLTVDRHACDDVRERDAARERHVTDRDVVVDHRFEQCG